MALYSNNRQLLAKLEDVEGQFNAPSASDALLVLDSDYKANVEVIEREVARSSHTRKQSLIGQAHGQVTCGLDLRANGDAVAANSPRVGVLLQGCGYKEERTIAVVLTAGAAYGGAEIHSTLQFTPSGATARLAKHISVGENIVFVDTETGTITAGDLVKDAGGINTIGTVAASGRISDRGTRYRPQTLVVAKVKVTASSWTNFAIHKTFKGGTSNAYGITRAFAAVQSEAGVFWVYYEPLGGMFVAGETLSWANGDTGTATVGASAVNATAYMRSLSLEYNRAGVRRQMAGCRGTGKLMLEAGKPGRWNFDFQGQIANEQDAALQANPSYGDLAAANPLRWANAALYLNDLVFPCRSCELDLGNQVVLRHDPLGNDGVGGFLITGRKPTITVDPEQKSLAMQDWYAKLKSLTIGNVYLDVGTVLGNRVSIYAPKTQITVVEDQDRDGLFVRRIVFEPIEDTTNGDDELWISFF